MNMNHTVQSAPPRIYPKARLHPEITQNEKQVAITEIENEFNSKYSPDNQSNLVDIDDLKFEFYRSTWEKLPNFDDIKAETMGNVNGGKFDTSLATRDHSYGFVDEATPELAIGVVPMYRGQGIGGAMLSALVDHARDAGVQQISLSVERDNPSRHLYQRQGYEIVDQVQNAWTMVLATGRAKG